jgi:hypothetical protein
MPDTACFITVFSMEEILIEGFIRIGEEDRCKESEPPSPVTYPPPTTGPLLKGKHCDVLWSGKSNPPGSGGGSMLDMRSLAESVGVQLEQLFKE